MEALAENENATPGTFEMLDDKAYEGKLFDLLPIESLHAFIYTYKKLWIFTIFTNSFNII